MLMVKNLTIIYPDGTKALNDLNFSVKKEEKIALIGANGAGKTSLLYSLVGILDITKGEITINQITLNKKNIEKVRKNIGLVFQNPDDQLFMPIIWEDIAFGLRNYGISEEEIKKKIDDILKKLNIEYLSKRSPLKMSGGEKRSSAIATVLVMEPNLVLFDEPTAFLDSKSRRNLIKILKNISYSSIIATHDLTFALEVCDRVIMLKEGNLFADGLPKDILFNKKIMNDCYIEEINRY